VTSKDEFVKFFDAVLRLQMMLAETKNQNVSEFFSKNKIWPKLAVKTFMGLSDEVIYEGERYLNGKHVQTNEDLFVQ